MNEYDAAGTPALKKRYIYGSYIDEVLYMYDADADEDYYYAHDHLYSPTALLDDSGSVVERIEYNAYGQADVTLISGPGTGNEYLFTGRRLDILDGGSLKIYYYRNRYYDPHTGRFLTHDPLGITPNAQKPNRWRILTQYRDTMILYCYVKNGPTGAKDPFGLRRVYCGQDEKTYGVEPFDWPLYYFPQFDDEPVQSASERGPVCRNVGDMFSWPSKKYKWYGYNKPATEYIVLQRDWDFVKERCREDYAYIEAISWKWVGRIIDVKKVRKCSTSIKYIYPNMAYPPQMVTETECVCMCHYQVRRTGRYATADKITIGWKWTPRWIANTEKECLAEDPMGKPPLLERIPRPTEPGPQLENGCYW